MDIEFQLESPDLEMKIDTYLIEQVLINLLLNAMDAVKNVDEPKITLIASDG